MSQSGSGHGGPVMIQVGGRGNMKTLSPEDVKITGLRLRSLDDGRVVLHNLCASPVIGGRTVPPAQNRTLNVGDQFTVGDVHCRIVRPEHK